MIPIYSEENVLSSRIWTSCSHNFPQRWQNICLRMAKSYIHCQGDGYQQPTSTNIPNDFNVSASPLNFGLGIWDSVYNSCDSKFLVH